MSNEVPGPEPREQEQRSVFLLNPTIYTLQEMSRVADDSPRELTVWSLDLAAWSAQSAIHGLDVYAVKLGSHVALKLSSPMIDATKMQKVDEEWSSDFQEIRSAAKDKRDGLVISLENARAADSLDDIARQTGVEQDLVLNHSPFMLRWALRASLTGMMVVAFDWQPDRSYSVWDSKYNRRYNDRVENDIVEFVKDRYSEEVREPVVSAA